MVRATSMSSLTTRPRAAAPRVASARSTLTAWRWACVSAVDSNGRTIWIADAHRDDGKRFVVHADEILTAFLELESAIPPLAANWLDELSSFSKLGVAKRI